jgi:hypothetical protein
MVLKIHHYRLLICIKNFLKADKKMLLSIYLKVSAFLSNSKLGFIISYICTENSRPNIL